MKSGAANTPFGGSKYRARRRICKQVRGFWSDLTTGLVQSVRPACRCSRCKPKASRRDQERHTSTHVDLNRCTTLVWSQARAAFKISLVLPASSFEQCHPHCMAHLPVSGQAVLIQQHFNNPSIETLLVNRYHQQQATSNIWRRGWSRVRCKKRDYNML